MFLSRRWLLIFLFAAMFWGSPASAETITFTSTNTFDSAWYWGGPGQILLGSILSGSATRGSTAQTVDISCGYNCWVSWGTGPGDTTSATSVAFGAAGSYVWIYGNDGAGNPTLFLDGTFANTTLTQNADGTLTLSSDFSGTLSPVLLGLLGLSTSGDPLTVSGTFTAVLAGTFNAYSGGEGWYDPNDPQSWGTGVLEVVVADDLPQAHAPVPEPGSLVLFGTGLLGVATAIRRKYSA